MTEDQRRSITEMLNPSGPPSSPPQAQVSPSAPASSPSSGGGGGSIRYTESAMGRFAATSDQRAVSFQRIQSQAGQDDVSSGAFGYMFGRLTYSAYERHVEAMTEGLREAAGAMTAIADGVRESAESIRTVDDETARAAGRAVGR